MTDLIREQYKDVRVNQSTRNEARRIRTKVHDARAGAHDAAERWPFELLQNALDAGPRAGRDDVSVRLSATDGVVVFEHDGQPFSLQDLAALLSGGSSKDFESEDQTGRFGTGFLVTHVLAERTRLDGIISANGRLERFSLNLDRSGDENAILENIKQCELDLEKASLIEVADGIPSAHFEYPADGESRLLRGLSAFMDALPYLYATRPKLGTVTIELPDREFQQWRATNEESKRIGSAMGSVSERRLEIRSCDGSTLKFFRALRFDAELAARGSCIVLLGHDEEKWRVRVPGEKSPRIFRDYPIRGSSFIPTNFIFNGKFDVHQERDRISMNDDDRSFLKTAFDAAILAFQQAIAEDWMDRHLLCSLYPCQRSFSGDDEEIKWWNSLLLRTAQALAAMPVVATKQGYGPAINLEAREWFADFPLPRLDGASQVDETTLERLWPLVNEVTDLYPPLFEYAVDWRAIAAGWTGLGMCLNTISVQRLGEYASDEVTEFGQLKVSTDRYDWLARFIDLVGECWKRRGGIDPHIFDHLLPSQTGALCSPQELKRDHDLLDELKDIAKNIGIDVRKHLLDKAVLAAPIATSLTHLKDAIERAIPNVLTEDHVLQDLVSHLEKTLPDDERPSKAEEAVVVETIRLLDYLAKDPSMERRSIARKVPLLAGDGKITRFASEKLLIAPSVSWHDSAQPFVDAYPPSRILDARYAGDQAANIPDTIGALADWGMAAPDPITEETAAELKEKGLASIAQNPADAANVVLIGQTFPQIALLRSAIFNRVEANKEAAKALLGLVLCYIATSDQRWRNFKVIHGRKAAETIGISVRDSLWVSDLRSRNWVIHENERGETTNVSADQYTLAPLLDPAWLEGNEPAIQLLSECFGFDALDLRLLGVAPVESDRKRLRDGIARLVETAGADPSTYDALREGLLSKSRRERDVRRAQSIGFAIQAAISEALADKGLDVDVIDRGFDLAVSDPETVDLDDLATWVQVGIQLVEVKATRTGEACMTPTQADTAAEQAQIYTLCVVDLRNTPDERLDSDWRGDDVEPLAKMVSDIGTTIKATCELVAKARTQPIGIRNETTLRYTAKPSIWEAGDSIGTWVAKRFGK